MKRKRYLITTSDEKTWKFDEPVIFLDEWCRRYNRRHIWQKMDAIVMEPYGVEPLKKKHDHQEAENLKDKIFPEFCKLLNKYHCSNYSERFWLIVTGPWFLKIIRVLINRVNTLKLLFDKHDISGTSVYSEKPGFLISSNFLQSTKNFQDDKWNNILIFKILNLLNEIQLPVEYINTTYNYSSLNKNILSEKKNLLITKKIKNFIKYINYNISKRLIKDHDAFIINPYLSFVNQLKLDLLLGQCPQFWRFYWNKKLWPKIIIEPNMLLRKDLSKKLAHNVTRDLEKIIRLLLFELLPTCYLEGFAKMEGVVSNLKWPNSPKFIFTSNSYNTDEFFKLWTAKKIDSSKKKYFIGQHGSNYGTRWDTINCIEEITPDKFITWGWSDKSSKIVPGFVLKTANSSLNHNPSGNLLLIETICLYKFTTYDFSHSFLRYLNEQKIFVSKLKKSPREKLIIRLHSGSQKDNWYQRERWYDFDKSLKIDNGSGSIKNLLKKTRVALFSYDSSGFLENLSLNFPTLAFWQDNFDDYRKTAIPYYKPLLDNGIIHLSPESAATKINEIWSDVEGWWSQSHVQKARKQFCDQFAKTSKKPILDLKKILVS